MKKFTKRIIALLLCLTVFTACFSAVNMAALANTSDVQTKVVNNIRYKYTVEDKKATIKHMQALGDETEISIPSKLGGYPVTTLNGYFFVNDIEADFEQAGQKVKTVVIPNSVKTVKAWAFAFCDKIETVKIGKGVTKIGKNAFWWCTGLKKFSVDKNNTKYASLNDNLVSKGKTVLYKYPEAKAYKNVTINRSIKKIKENAIHALPNLKSLNLNNVEVVEDGAIEYCTKLETIKFGKNMKSYSGANVFYNKSLKSITVPSNNKYFCSPGGVLYNKKKTKLILYPHKKSGTKYTIPKTVTTIGKFAFYCNNTLKTIVFPSNLKKIGRLGCFEFQKLESVNLKNTKLTEIADSAFAYCPKLSEIKLPKGLKKVGKYAFANHRAENVVIPKNVEEIGKYAFASNKMETIKILGDKTELTKSSFRSYTEGKEKKYYTTIIAHKDSNAQKFAIENNIPFEELK